MKQKIIRNYPNGDIWKVKFQKVLQIELQFEGNHSMSDIETKYIEELRTLLQAKYNLKCQQILGDFVKSSQLDPDLAQEATRLKTSTDCLNFIEQCKKKSK